MARLVQACVVLKMVPQPIGTPTVCSTPHTLQNSKLTEPPQFPDLPRQPEDIPPQSADIPPQTTDLPYS